MDIEKEIERFYDECKRHSLKVTPQRTVLFEELASTIEHPTAEALYRKLRTRLPNISYDTVNRTLMNFADLGIIRRVESRDSSRRFDADVSLHHHFECVRCGSIIDIHSDLYDNLADPEELPEGVTVLDIRVTLEGFCGNCRN